MAYDIELNGLQFKNAEGKNIIGSDFKVEIKELDELNRTFWAIASEESPDRDKDIIRVEGWNLKNYKNAPRGLWMHNYFEFAIFRSEKIKIDKNTKQLLFKPKFDDSHDRARIAWNQYKNGFLDDFSVGFIPGQFAWNDENDMWSGGRDFTKGHELLEISGVTVPAHPNAQMLRSIGLIPEDQISLMTLGFKSDFMFDKDTNSYWYPILLDMNAYKKPKQVKLGKGLTVVKAFSRFDAEKEMVVGYWFDKDNFNNEKAITEWVDSQLLVKPTKKFYQIGFSEDKTELDINIINEEINIIFTNPSVENIPIEESSYDFDDVEENKDLSTSDVPEPMLNNDEGGDIKYCACELFEANEEDTEKCKGCGGRKPKTVDPVVVPDNEDDKSLENVPIDKKVVDNNFIEKSIEEILQKFDKSYEDKVKDIVTELDFVKVELAELKRLMLEMAETNKKDLKESSDDQLLDLGELNLSLVPSPVSKDEDDSDKIQIDSETFNQLSKDAVINAISETFKQVFEQEKNKLSGKLDD